MQLRGERIRRRDEDVGMNIDENEIDTGTLVSSGGATNLELPRELLAKCCICCSAKAEQSVYLTT